MKACIRTDMAREHLALGRTLRVSTEGFSMWPLLRPDRIVTIEPLGSEPLRVGDIVLLEASDAPVLHRVVSVRGGGGRQPGPSVLTKGDAMSRADGWQPQSAILGRIRRRPWDFALGRLSPISGRPLRIALGAWRTFFDRPWGRS